MSEQKEEWQTLQTKLIQLKIIPATALCAQRKTIIPLICHA
jgi:hypothetical protein